MNKQNKKQKPFKYSMGIFVTQDGRLYTIEVDEKGKKARKSL